MNYSIESFIEKITHQPEELTFDETLAVIDNNYEFTETGFNNGDQRNNAGQNSGSCKVFAFAKMHNLSKQQTLYMFAQYYRDDVLTNPEGDDHQNIRQFMQHGFSRITFEADALKSIS